MKEQFEIKESGLYRTHDGRKAFVSYVESRGVYPATGMIEGSTEIYFWTEEGYDMKHETVDTDIVSKWED